MKKLFLVLSLITISVITKAQTEPGTIYVGGGVNYSNFKSEYAVDNYFNSDNQHHISVMPTVGMFINSKWAIGITPTFDYLEITNVQPLGGTTTRTASYIGGGLELRYYIPLGSKFAFFPQLSGTYTTSVGNTSVESGHKISGLLSPSFAFFPIPKVSINMLFGGIGWIKQTETTKPQNGSPSIDNNSTNFIVSAGNIAGLSVAYHFTKK